jgi:hypothetical protein
MCLLTFFVVADSLKLHGVSGGGEKSEAEKKYSQVIIFSCENISQPNAAPMNQTQDRSSKRTL